MRLLDVDIKNGLHVPFPFAFGVPEGLPGGNSGLLLRDGV